MSKKISTFWNNFKIYIVIGITLLVVLLASILVVRNITKDKSEVNNDSKSLDQDENSQNTVELTEEVTPLEPTPPSLELPEIQ